jgi:chromosome partitioning protein
MACESLADPCCHPPVFLVAMSASPSCPVIAVTNQKGGTAKSTTAVNLAAGLAKTGRRVLLADLDPQGHATYYLGFDLDDITPPPFTIEEIFDDFPRPIAELALSTAVPTLRLLPSNIRLARVPALLADRSQPRHVLKRALALIRPDYDYIILDCQPSLDVLSLNALHAANRVLIPTQFAGGAIRGLSELLTTIYQEKEGADDFDYRILLTMVTGMAENRQARGWELLKPLEDRILKTRIRRTESIEQSQMEVNGAPVCPVVLQSRWTPGAKDYRDLVREIEETWPR